MLAGRKMQFVAHPEQKILGLFQLRDIRGIDNTREGQAIEIFNFKFGARDPASGLNIPKPAFAFLDIGLEQVDRAPKLFMPSAILFELFADESFEAFFYQPRFDSLFEVLIKSVIAAEKTGIEKRSSDFHVNLRKAHTFGDAACRVTDLKPGVPERIE